MAKPTKESRVAFLNGADSPPKDLLKLKSFEAFQRVKTPFGDTLLLLADQSKDEDPFFTFQVENKSGKTFKLYQRRGSVGLDEGKIKEEEKRYESYGLEVPKTVSHGVGYLVQESPSGRQTAAEFRQQWVDESKENWRKSQHSPRDLEAAELGFGEFGIVESSDHFSIRQVADGKPNGDTAFAGVVVSVVGETPQYQELRKIYLKSIELGRPLDSLNMTDIYWSGTHWLVPNLKKAFAEGKSTFRANFRAHTYNYWNNTAATPEKRSPEQIKLMARFLSTNVGTDVAHIAAFLTIPTDKTQQELLRELVEFATPTSLAAVKAIAVQPAWKSENTEMYLKALTIPDPRVRKMVYFGGTSDGPIVSISPASEIKTYDRVRLPSGKLYTSVGEHKPCPPSTRCYSVVEEGTTNNFELYIPENAEGGTHLKTFLQDDPQLAALGLLSDAKIAVSDEHFTLRSTTSHATNGHAVYQSWQTAGFSGDFKEMIALRDVFVHAHNSGHPIGAYDVKNLQWSGEKWFASSMEALKAPPTSGVPMNTAMYHYGHYALSSPDAARRNDPGAHEALALSVVENTAQDYSVHLPAFLQKNPKQGYEKDLLSKLVEVADARMVNSLKTMVGRDPYYQTEEFKPFVQALDIPDLGARRAFLHGVKDVPPVDLTETSDPKVWEKYKLPSGKVVTVVQDDPSCASSARCLRVQDEEGHFLELSLPKARTAEGMNEWKESLKPHSEAERLGFNFEKYTETNDLFALKAKTAEKPITGVEWLANWTAAGKKLDAPAALKLRDIYLNVEAARPDADLDLSQIKWTGSEWTLTHLDSAVKTDVADAHSASTWADTFSAHLVTAGTDAMKMDPANIKLAVAYYNGLDSKLREKDILVHLAHPTEGNKALVKALVESGETKVLTEVHRVLATSAWAASEFDRDRKALLISNPEKRAKFISKADEASPEFKLAGKTFAPGAEITTTSGKHYEIIKATNDMKWSTVYQVKDKDGKLFALKVAKAKDPETLEAFHEEIAKTKAWETLGVAHAKVLEISDDHVLKDWVDGKRADDWLKEWAAAGSKSDTPEFKRLREILYQSAYHGHYIGDLGPHDFIWNGTDWILIDSGTVKSGYTLEETLKRYEEKMSKRWSKIDPACVSIFLGL